jgi:hypothetical protein
MMSRSARVAPAALVALILLMACGVRVVGVADEGLWYDEMWSATFASLNPWEITLSALRFDIHPPGWFYQLRLWSLAGGSDFWLMLNSVFWSMLSLAMVMYAADRLFSRTTAVLAGLLLALAPVAVELSSHVRQYAALTAVTPAAWYLSERYLRGERERLPVFSLGALVLFAVYSHGSGPFIATFLGVAGLGAAAAHRTSKQRVRAWLSLQIWLALLSVPGGAVALIRTKADNLTAPDIQQAGTDLAHMFFGRFSRGEDLPMLVALGLWLALLVAALVFRRGRVLILAFVHLPFASFAIVSHLGKPIWFGRAFWFLIPMICLGLAVTIDNLADAARRLRVPRRVTLVLLGGTAVSVFSLATVEQIGVRVKPRTYEQLIPFIEAHAAPGDVVYVPSIYDYWGVARYIAGSGWGSPLEVQDLVLEQAAPHKWGTVLEWLGPAWRERLGLEPETNYIEHEDIRLYVGFGALDDVLEQAPRRILVVYRTDTPRPWPAVDGYACSRSEYLFVRSDYGPAQEVHVCRRDAVLASET